MKHLILFGLSALTTLISGETNCHACFYNICYSRAVITQNYSITRQLAVDRVVNAVYFHYEDTRNHTVAFDLDEMRFLNIPDIQFSLAQAVNQATRDVYFGGVSGIYRYNPNTNETTGFGLSDKTIMHMQFKNKIYYTIFMAKGLFTFEKNLSETISALKDYTIEDFIVDKRDDIYFTSNFNVFVLKKGETKPTLFSNVTFSLSTDMYDNAYFVQKEDRGLYKIDYKRGLLNEVGIFGSGSPLKAVFDNFNNVIYYDEESVMLVYLKPNYGRCKVFNEGRVRYLKKIMPSTLV